MHKIFLFDAFGRKVIISFELFTFVAFGYYGAVHGRELGGLQVGGDARLGCSSMNNDKINAGVLIQPPPDCAGWEQRWQTLAARDKGAVLALMLGAWEILDQRVNGVTLKYPDPRWSALVERSLRHAVAVLAAHGRTVHVFQVPCYGTGDPQHPLPARGDQGRVNAINAMLERIAHEIPRVQVVRWRDLVCPNGTRVEKVNGVQLWQNDNVHLTEPGVVQVWKWWLPQLRRAQR